MWLQWRVAFFLLFVADGRFDRAGSFSRTLRDQGLVVVTDRSIVIGCGFDGQFVTFHVALLTSFFALEGIFVGHSVRVWRYRRHLA